MPTYTTPGVYYEVVDQQDLRPVALRTDVAGFVGVAPRGPVGVPVRVASWRQFESAFGGLYTQGFLGYAVKAFFENGGRICHVVRVAAPVSETRLLAGTAQPADGRSSLVEPAGGYVAGAVVTVSQETDPIEVTRLVQAIEPLRRRLAWDAPLTADFWLNHPIVIEGPEGAVTLTPDGERQPYDRHSTLVRSVAGFSVGDAVRIRQTERRRQEPRRIAAVEAGGGRLGWETPLVPSFDVAQPLRLVTGAASASTTFINTAGEPVLEVEASSPGAWGNALLVQLTASVGAATRTRDDVQPLDRASSLVADVSGLQRGDLVRAFQQGARPPTAYLVVAAVDAHDRRLTWRQLVPDERLVEPRLASEALLPSTFDLQQAIAFERVDFSLNIYAEGQLREIIPTLSVVPVHPRFAPQALGDGASTLIVLRDARTDLPSAAAQLALPSSSRWLLGGRDGLAALGAPDIVGLAGPVPLGIAALAGVDEVAILAAPDAHLRPGPEQQLVPVQPPVIDPCLPGAPPEATAPPPPPTPVERPPSFGPEETFEIQAALVAQCERLRDRFAVLEPPAGGQPALQEGLAGVRAWRKRFDSMYAALYFPWLAVRDPLQRGPVRLVPPSGHVTGLYARFDLAQGVHRAPANGELEWAHSVRLAIDDAVHGVLNPEGINAIRAFPGRGIRVYGARTLSSDPAWRYVNVRRLMSMIEESVEEASQWAVFEPNDFFLRETLRLGIGGLLEEIWQAGGLVGTVPEDAYFVKCDDANNPPTLADAGQLVMDVGVAPAVPGEFVVFRVGRTQDVLEVAESGVTGLSNIGSA